MIAQRRALTWLLAGLLPAFAVIPALTQPIEEYGLDAAYFHVYRAVLFSEARAEGWPYPRWLPDLNAGLGGPLLTFYPPGAYFALDFLNQLGVPHPLGWRVLIAAALVLASLGAFGLVRALFRRDEAALACAAVFAYSPYLLYDLLERAGPQGLATALFPWLLWGLLALAESPSGLNLTRAAIPWAAIILLHNSTAVLFLALLLPFMIFLALRCGRSALGWSALALLVGGLLSAFHALPFVLDAAWVRAQPAAMPEWAQPARNPLALAQVLSGPTLLDLGAGWNSFEEKAGWLQIAALPIAAALAMWFGARRNWALAWLLASVALLGAGVLWLTTDSSTWAWRALPALDIIQFRGRLLLLLSTAALLTFGALLTRAADVLTASRFEALAGAPAVSLSLVGVLLSLPFTYPTLLLHYNRFSPHPDVAEVRDFMARTGLFGLTSMEQFIPRWRTQPFTHEELSLAGAAPIANLPEDSRVLSVQRQSQSWLIEVESASTFRASLRQLYYPAWQAEVNGQPAPLEPEAETGYSRVEAPAGQSLIELRYVATRGEQAGQWLSAFTLIVLFGAVFAWRGRAGSAALPAELSARAALVWLLVVVSGAILKISWVDPQTTLFRQASSCAQPAGAQTPVEVNFGSGLAAVRLQPDAAHHHRWRGCHIDSRLGAARVRPNSHGRGAVAG